MRFFLRRFVALLFTLLAVSVLCFVAFKIIPGDSAMIKLGIDADDEAIEALRHALGLDRNVFVRFADWIRGIAVGDFGVSSQYSVPVIQLLLPRLRVTTLLAVEAIFIMLVIAFPLGFLTARRENGFFDRTIGFLGQVTMAIPPFFLGIVLTLVFGVVLHLFVPGTCPKWEDGPGELLLYLIWPALAIAIPKISMVVKFLRSSIFREYRMDYVRTARSKGVNERKVLRKHVLKNALMPVITFVGMMIADILAGSIVVETVFNVPGIGKSLILSIANRDFNVAQTIILYISFLIIVMNFIVDVLYKAVDPRV
ncbi:MAG: ABC transporter permease [Lachnospiraceae bacterium]|nr:ABC transporter permease [Lachnospiraceae bacterium]MBP5185349.1 ABC transporter permease [Lachnospiraceae bacterium]